MTMKREAKAEAQRSLAPAGDGYTNVRFASPKLIKAALEERGHTRMTPAEVAKHRMGRGEVHPSMIEELRRTKAGVQREQRLLGGRRITGRQPGTKDPQAWGRERIERGITRK